MRKGFLKIFSLFNNRRCNMYSALRNIMLCVLTVGMLLSTAYGVSYGSGSIALEKDVIIDLPEVGLVNLPDEVTFRIYDSNTAAAPIASQSFSRGGYSAYYNIAKSDGLIQKSYVKFMVDFTNFTNAYSGTGSLWVGIELNGTPAGEREQLDKETTSLMLSALASGNAEKSGSSDSQNADNDGAGSASQTASATQKGDDSSSKGSLTIIYKDAGAGSDGLVQYNNGGTQAGASNLYYDDINGFLGVGTTTPSRTLHVRSSGPYIGFERTGTYARQYDFGFYFNSFAIVDVTAASATRLVVTDTGNVGIGTVSPCADCLLAVNGKIRAKSVVVDTGWSDFVFEDNYKLMPLQEVEKFIKDNRHLPEIPSEADVKKNGVSVGDISSKLLQKIEELTLYMIELKKENETLRSDMSVLKKHSAGDKKNQ